MEWTQVKLYTTTEAIEIVSGFLISHGLRGIMIEDAQDFQDFLEDTTIHWDYIDDELMKMKECETAVIFYIPDNMQGLEMLRQIRGSIESLRRKPLLLISAGSALPAKASGKKTGKPPGKNITIRSV